MIQSLKLNRRGASEGRSPSEFSLLAAAKMGVARAARPASRSRKLRNISTIVPFL
jgi:hypothetical protein